MSDNVKSVCKNYNVIVNCEFLEDDLFSKKLVDYYKNAVIRLEKNPNCKDRVTKYDRVMRKYIEDYNFSKKLRNSVDVTSILTSKVDLTDAVLEYVVDFSSKYDTSIEEPVINTRWI